VVELVKYAFTEQPSVGQAVDPAKVAAIAVGDIPGAGLSTSTTDYTGDGTNDRLIDVGLAAKFYTIFRRTDDNRDSADLLAFDSVSWTVFFDGGFPYKKNESYVSGTGINVGKIFLWQGGANFNGVDYRIIAFG